jgi:hypothetical protein
MDMSSLWFFAVVGGFVILGLVMAYGFLQSRKKDAEIDPAAPASDPSKGLDSTNKATRS